MRSGEAMDNLVLYKLVGEVRQQCRFAEIGFRELRGALPAMDSERVFFHVHSFLACAAAVSCWLWPKRPESAERGNRLRAELKVEDQSPLKLGGVRDPLAREDEQMEDWITGLENPNYVDMNVMALGTMAGTKEDTFHRDLDPEHLRFRHRGVEFDLRQISDELRKLQAAADIWQRTHNPW